MSDIQDIIKAKFSTRLADVEPSLIYLELPSGERVEDLDDIPVEHFLKPEDPKSKKLRVKWDSTIGNKPRYLNVQLDVTKTEVNLKNCQRMSDLRRDIKAEFSTDVEPSLIYLELPNGERVEDLDDIPDEYFIEDAEYVKIKWDFNGML
jgi:hypothetical protein